MRDKSLGLGKNREREREKEREGGGGREDGRGTQDHCCCFSPTVRPRRRRSAQSTAPRRRPSATASITPAEQPVRERDVRGVHKERRMSDGVLCLRGAVRPAHNGRRRGPGAHRRAGAALDVALRRHPHPVAAGAAAAAARLQHAAPPHDERVPLDDSRARGPRPPGQREGRRGPSEVPEIAEVAYGPEAPPSPLDSIGCSPL